MTYSTGVHCTVFIMVSSMERKRKLNCMSQSQMILENVSSSVNDCSYHSDKHVVFKFCLECLKRLKIMYKILKLFLMEFFWNTKSNIWIVLIDIQQLQYWRAFEMKLWNAMEYMRIGECIDSRQRPGKQIWEWNMLNKIWLISGLCYKYCLEEIWEGEQLGIEEGASAATGRRRGSSWKELF